MSVFDAYAVHALIAGILLSLATAPLGCFVVWRKMAYLGDALSHAALIGIVLGLVWHIPISLSIIPVSVGVSLLLMLTGQRSRLSSDTLLGVFAHGGLALGMVAMALLPNVPVDMMGYLFGDILAVTTQDLVFMYMLSGFVLITLWLKWRSFMLLTLHEDIAKLNGIGIRRHRFWLMMLIALTVALSIKLVGLLLVTSMLVVPAAAARFVSRTPPQMAWLATVISILTVFLGLSASLELDIPSGPAMVATAVLVFVVIAIISSLGRKRA